MTSKPFSLFSLSLPSRLILAALFYAACVFSQLALDLPLVGLVFVVPAWFVLSLKRIHNKPDDQGLENWRAVGEAEVHRIADNISNTKKLQAQVVKSGCLPVLLHLGLVALVFLFLGEASFLSLALADLACFVVPGLYFGGVSFFIPPELVQKLPSVLAVMNHERPKDLILTPYIRFDQDKERNEIPEDLRLMVEPRRKPEALVGVQMQVAINKGPNGQVPYMYAVILLRGRSDPLYRRLSGIKLRGYEVEAGGDDDYGTVVIRQLTSGTGYHTKEADCQRLFQAVARICAELAS